MFWTILPLTSTSGNGLKKDYGVVFEYIIASKCESVANCDNLRPLLFYRQALEKFALSDLALKLHIYRVMVWEIKRAMNSQVSWYIQSGLTYIWVKLLQCFIINHILWSIRMKVNSEMITYPFLLHLVPTYQHHSPHPRCCCSLPFESLASFYFHSPW